MSPLVSLLAILIPSLVTGAALTGVAKTVQKATQGQYPWEDPVGHLKDISIDSIPVAGPLVEAGTEGGDWGSAGLQSGIQAVGLGLGALGGAAPALENAGTVASQEGVAGAATLDSLSALSRETANLATQTGTPSGVLGEYLGSIGQGLKSIDEATVGPIAARIGQGPTDVLRGAIGGAARGAVSDYRNPGRGALGGAVGGAVSAGVNVGVRGIPSIKPLETSLVPNSELDLTSSPSDYMNQQITGIPQSYWQRRWDASENQWRALGQRGIVAGKSALEQAASTTVESPVRRALTPDMRPQPPQIDPYSYFRYLPEMSRRRLL